MRLSEKFGFLAVPGFFIHRIAPKLVANILENINSGVLGVLLMISFGDPICVQPTYVISYDFLTWTLNVYTRVWFYKEAFTKVNLTFFRGKRSIFRCGYRISIRGFVRLSVRWSIGPSVGPSVGNLFFWRAETKTANDLFHVYELVTVKQKTQKIIFWFFFANRFKLIFSELSLFGVIAKKHK